MEKMLTPQEVVDYFDGMINLNTLANWRHKNRGPAYLKIGGRVRYAQSVIEEFKRNAYRDPAAEAAAAAAAKEAANV